MTFDNPQAQPQGQPGKERKVVLAVVVLGEGAVHSPRMMSITSSPPLVGAKLS